MVDADYFILRNELHVILYHTPQPEYHEQAQASMDIVKSFPLLEH